MYNQASSSPWIATRARVHRPYRISIVRLSYRHAYVWLYTGVVLCHRIWRYRIQGRCISIRSESCGDARYICTKLPVFNGEWVANCLDKAALFGSIIQTLDKNVLTIQNLQKSVLCTVNQPVTVMRYTADMVWGSASHREYDIVDMAICNIQTFINDIMEDSYTSWIIRATSPTGQNGAAEWRKA